MRVKLPEKCPICGTNMRKGYLSTGFRLRWGEEKPSFWVRKGYLHKGVEVMVGDGTLGTNVKAHMCSDCKIVLFSYEKEEVGDIE